jgi:hypothetical protein
MDGQPFQVAHFHQPMTNPERDSRFIETALPELQDYLLSDELYWPLGGSLPRLTPGALLLALRRAEAHSPAPARKWQLELDAVRRRWRSAWEQKALREAKNRLRLWSASVGEWQSAPAENLADYTGEVRGRVILQILLDEVNAPAEQAALGPLDDFLRARLKPGNFLWETGLETAFPQSEFWFLYGKLT